MDNESAELLARWQDGDEQAATDLFHRYAERLIALARVRLSEKLARRLDAEDVVQSAYRSFFTGARDGRYVVLRSGDLWRLLVAITIHKLHHQVEHHTAGKRAVHREEHEDPAGGRLAVAPEHLAKGPTPAEAAALADELERLMRGMDDLQRRMLELRLQGYTLGEVAAETGRSERTVRRFFEHLKAHLERQYAERVDA